tara:strand:- start:28 stop:165 length:138 start_codon:yes stop_codon:yes gene_type:complete
VGVAGEPKRIYSSFIKGYTELPVILHTAEVLGKYLAAIDSAMTTE